MKLPVLSSGRKLGGLRDKTDNRDMKLKMALPLPSTLSTHPWSATCGEWMGEVKDQGMEGSCVGHGGAEATEFLYRRYRQLEVKLSPQMVYFLGRQKEGDVNLDEGMQIRTAMQVLASTGTCREDLDPDVYSRLKVAPTDAIMADAALHKIGAYHSIIPGDLQTIKSIIASEYVIVFGMLVYPSFDSPDVAKSGEMLMPQTGESQIGGHCAVLYEYDDTHVNVDGSHGAARVRNSYGKGWGQDGDFWMPYAYLSNPANVYDLWVPHLGKPWVPKG